MGPISNKLSFVRCLLILILVGVVSLSIKTSDAYGWSEPSENLRTPTAGVAQSEEAIENQVLLTSTIEQDLTPQSSLNQINAETSTLQITNKEAVPTQGVNDTEETEGVSYDITPSEGTPEPALFPTSTNVGLVPPTVVVETQWLEFDSKILVKVDTTTNSAIREALVDYGNIVPSPLEELGIFVLEVNQAPIDDQLNQLILVPGVVYAERNYYVETLAVPNDPLVTNQYALEAIRAYQAWNYATGMSSVTLAILDTGVDFAHQEFAGRLVAGYDFVNLDDDPQDDHGHGTSVTGVAAAIANNSEGIAGIDWGAQIMPVKVLNSSGVGTYADVASGIVWAVNNGGDVINLSLGGSGAPASTALLDAVNYAYSNGLVIVAAAGNSNSGVFYPATYDNVIAVAATDLTNTRMGNSNYGPDIDVSAPGSSILSTSLGGGYGYGSGTSMAAPYVSGLSAILKAIDPSLSPEAIEAILKTSALDLGPQGFDDFYGAGLIQADSAVLLVIVPPLSGNVVEEELVKGEDQNISSTKAEQATQAAPASRTTEGSTVVVGQSDVSALISTPTAAEPIAEQVAAGQSGVYSDDLGTVQGSQGGWLVYLEYGLVTVLSIAVLYLLFLNSKPLDSSKGPL